MKWNILTRTKPSERHRVTQAWSRLGKYSQETFGEFVYFKHYHSKCVHKA